MKDHGTEIKYFLNLKCSQMSVSGFSKYIWLNHNRDDRLTLKWNLGLEVEVSFEEFFDSNTPEPMDSPDYHEYLASLWKVLKIHRFADVGIENIVEGNLIEINDKNSPDVVKDLNGNILWK